MATADPNSTPRASGWVIVAFFISLAVVVGVVYVGVRYINGDYGRSVSAYCTTWKEEGTKLHDKWAAQQRKARQSDNPFGAMQTVMGAPQDLANFFGALDKVAPDEIRPAVHQYAQAWQTTADNLGSDAADPLSFASAQLGVILMSGGAEQEIDSWTQAHCTTSN